MGLCWEWATDKKDLIFFQFSKNCTFFSVLHGVMFLRMCYKALRRHDEPVRTKQRRANQSPDMHSSLAATHAELLATQWNLSPNASFCHWAEKRLAGVKAWRDAPSSTLPQPVQQQRGKNIPPVSLDKPLIN